VDETKEVLRELPRLRGILKVARSLPRQDYETSGLPYFEKLSEVRAYISNNFSVV